MKINSVDKLFEEEIRDMYDAEKQLVKALPKLAKAASSEELRAGFQEHLEATKGHVSRLEEVFQSIGVTPKGKTCKAMKGLVEEGAEAIEENEQGEFRDILLIGAAKRVEHYEMAAYQSAILLANSLGNDQAVELLESTLAEEEETDERLQTLCEDLLGQMSGDGAEEDGEEVEEEEDAAPKVRRAT